MSPANVIPAHRRHHPGLGRPAEGGTAYLLYTDEFYRIAKELRHYDAETHRGMFALPKYLRQGLAGETLINRDDAPVFMA